MFGADANCYFPGLNIFGECARSYRGDLAFVGGFIAQLSDALSTSMLFRNYPAAFITMHGGSFGEGGSSHNETGIYFGLRYKPHPKFLVNTYVDQFRFPSPPSTVPLPSSGIEEFIDAEWTLSTKLRLSGRYKGKIKEVAVAAFDEYGRDIRPVTQRFQQNYRFEIAYSPPSKTTFTMRAEYVTVSYSTGQPVQTGYMLFAGLRHRISGSFIIGVRAAAIHTTSYDSRLYMYEEDVPGAMSNAGLSSDGIRVYVLATWKLHRRLDISFKYGETMLQGVKCMGSGDDSVAGDSLGKLSLQMDFKL